MPNILITLIALPCISLAFYAAYIAFKDGLKTKEMEAFLIGWLYATVGVFLTIALVRG